MTVLCHDEKLYSTYSKVKDRFEGERDQFTERAVLQRQTHTHTRHTETFITCASAWTSCVCQERGMHFQNQTCAELCPIK